MTWTGIVYDVGAAGVNLRSDPQVRPDDARDTAARGARLALSCGQTGDVVAKGPVRTATWVKTTDGLFVSMLYVRIPDRASIPSCNGSKVDGPLLALADPGHPELPPPPGTQLGGEKSQDSEASGSSAASGPVARPGGQPGVVASPNGVALAAPPTKGQTVAPQAVAPAPAVTAKSTIGTGTGQATTTNTTPAPNPGVLTPRAAHPQPNPDTTPVG
jgi:hypothetical protein